MLEQAAVCLGVLLEQSSAQQDTLVVKDFNNEPGQHSHGSTSREGRKELRVLVVGDHVKARQVVQSKLLQPSLI